MESSFGQIGRVGDLGEMERWNWGDLDLGLDTGLGFETSRDQFLMVLISVSRLTSLQSTYLSHKPFHISTVLFQISVSLFETILLSSSSAMIAKFNYIHHSNPSRFLFYMIINKMV